MKLFLSCMLLLLFNQSHAQVYKCTSTNTYTNYQDKPCAKANKGEKVTIEQFDTKKIAKAQYKLAEELKRNAEEEKIQLEQQLKEREVSALEKNAQATESIAKANWYQAEITERNNQYQPNGYFYYPIPLRKKPYYKKNKEWNSPIHSTPDETSNKTSSQGKKLSSGYKITRNR